MNERREARFLRGLAHEVRTPLASILMLTELLAEGPDGLSEKQLAQVRKIRRAAADVSLLIDQLSTLARVADGRLKASPGTVDLEELVAELAGELSARGPAPTFEVTWEPGAPRTLPADRLILRQVLGHLLDHAAGAARDGIVALAVGSAGGGAAISVSDRGAAVPEDQQDVFFEAFPEGGPRARRSTGGTALALPLAAALTGLLGGRLELESGRQRGVTLTLFLPLASDPKG